MLLLLHMWIIVTVYTLVYLTLPLLRYSMCRIQQPVLSLNPGNMNISITPILNSLHWLPVVNRIKFKILLLVFRIKHGFAPTYLSNLLQPMIPSRSLRSSKHAHLQYNPGPRTYTRYGDRAFSVAAPKLWNGLPINIRNATSIECFKSNLKRFLFNSPNWLLWPFF